jgi:hypothetical protein
MSPQTYEIDINTIQNGTYIWKNNTDVQLLYLNNIPIH